MSIREIQIEYAMINWVGIRERLNYFLYFRCEWDSKPSSRFEFLPQTLSHFTVLQPYQIITTDNQTKIVFSEEKLNLSFKFAQYIYHLSIKFYHWPFCVILSIEICKKSLEIICIYVNF